MGMNDLTEEEFWQLDIHKQQFYLEHREFMDFKFHNGQLCMVHHLEPHITWERFMYLFKTILYADYQRTDNTEPYITCRTDLEDWNPYGRPYRDYGFEYDITLNVHSEDYTREGKKAQKQILTDWLKAHNATEKELKAIYWNGHGYSAAFKCFFTDVPPEQLPPKVIKWLKKNPQYAPCCIKDYHEQL